jgi:hypothetical protein
MERLWQQDLLDHPTSAYFKTLITCSQNCQRRAQYEQELLREKGVSDAYPVSIPPTGAPTTTAITNDATLASDSHVLSN